MAMASSSRAVLLLVRHSCGGAAASACSNVRQVGSRALHRGKGVMQSAAAGHPPLGHPVGKRTYDDYLHAPHMYSIYQMRFLRAKVAAGVLSILGAGAGIPAFVVWWHLYRRTDIPASIPADPDQDPSEKDWQVWRWLNLHKKRG